MLAISIPYLIFETCHTILVYCAITQICCKCQIYIRYLQPLLFSPHFMASGEYLPMLFSFLASSDIEDTYTHISQ